MSRKNQIVRAVDGQTAKEASVGVEDETGSVAQAATPPAPAASEPAASEPDSPFATEPPRRDALAWITGALALLAIIGWSALYGWAMRAQLLAAGSAAPNEWVRWIIDWSVPVLLVCVVWMLAMRNSTREANRFAASAALLSRESAELENRLTVVNRELSLAREFLAAQARDLEALGRIAAERLSANAQDLQALIQNNGAQVEAIGTTSETALANMTRLRDDLPVIANSARDANNQLGSTGRTAREQLERLIEGFERLNQFGAASARQASAFGSEVGQTIETFEAQLARIEQQLGQRFEALRSQAEEYRGSISAAETEALEAMNQRIALLQSETRAIAARLHEAESEALEQARASQESWEQQVTEMIERLSQLDAQATQASRMRIKELNEEAGRFDDRLEQRDARFFEEMTRRQSEFAARETQAAELLSQRLAELDEMLAEKRASHLAETRKLIEQGNAIAEQLDQLGATIGEVGALGESTRAGLSEGMAELGDRLEAKRAALVETEASLTTLTDASVRLLEIIQSGARHSREDLPAAIETASRALSELEDRSTTVSGAMFTIGQKGDELSSYLIETKGAISEADASLGSLQERVAEQSDEALAKLNGLRGALERLSRESENYAGSAQDALIASIRELEEAVQEAITTLDEDARTRLDALAETLSSEAVAALERALRKDSAETIGKLEQAAAHASGVGREATIQLRDQLAKVNELTGNLEARIARAREQAQEQVDNDFARRIALITDSLNSASIDISKAMSTEVADTAWDAYLKGDRGIFTRRAVRLLDNGEARAVAELYQSDEAFKATVNRYIHDFEAMLRVVLSTRDGTALSVTILGSDMGKLYVALAQGIERLRK